LVGAAAKRSKDGPQARRLLALAAIYDGATRTEPAKFGGVTPQIIRNWVVKFNALGPVALIDRKPRCQPSRLNDVQHQATVRMIGSGPIPAIHGVVRWRLIDIAMDIRGVPYHGHQADAEPGAARDGLPEAVGPPAPSCASRGSHR